MSRNRAKRRFAQRWLWVWGLLAGVLLACGVPVNELNDLLITPTAVSKTPLPTAEPMPNSQPLSQPTPPPTAVVPQPPLSLDLEPTTPIIGPSASYEQIWAESDDQQVRLRLPLAQPLLLLVNPESGLDVAFTLLDEAGEIITSVDERGAGEPELLPFTLTDTVEQAQGYSVVVSVVGRDSTSAAYASTVAVLDLDGAGEETVRLDVTAVLEADEIGRHNLPATAGQAFFFLLEPDSTLDPLLELYTPGGFLFTEDSGGVGEPESRLFVAGLTTTYQLVIFPFGDSTGSYRLRAIALP